jgi:foldase protein PrsA
MAEKTKKNKPSRSKVTSSKAVLTTKTNESQSMPLDTDNSSMLMKNKNNIILVLVFIVVALLAYRLKSEFIVATVNGKPITRTAVISALEKQAGAQAVDGLIVQELIRQEAKKANITVSKQDAEKEVKDLEKQLKAQNQNLDEFLKAQGLKREDIVEQAQLQLMLEKLTAKDVKVTQADIDKAFEQQKDALKDNKDMTEKELRTQIEKSLKLQKQSAAVQAWIDAARKKAKIMILKSF